MDFIYLSVTVNPLIVDTILQNYLLILGKKKVNIYPTYLGQSRPHRGHVEDRMVSWPLACPAARSHGESVNDADADHHSRAGDVVCRTSGSLTSGLRWN